MLNIFDNGLSSIFVDDDLEPPRSLMLDATRQAVADDRIKETAHRNATNPVKTGAVIGSVVKGFSDA